ncbi:hypothetical protein NQ314_005812 [Rhamnusium bicolor]|uniref:Acetyl-CoA carboxylase beta subunit n=1 Tax=Rhamnusium bicolor TaxID=1586634 RepID=A0AAV8ZCA1_9CUCU|nr:hypothetical protein NQ314_005812 [Rhamnusium bicolor]
MSKDLENSKSLEMPIIKKSDWSHSSNSSIKTEHLNDDEDIEITEEKVDMVCDYDYEPEGKSNNFNFTYQRAIQDEGRSNVSITEQVK